MNRVRMIVFACLALCVVRVQAQPAPPAAGFEPRLGQALPLDTRWTDEMGHIAALDSFTHHRPAILAFAYYGCSNLCSLVLDSLARSLTMADLVAPFELEVVVVSIDPLDTPTAARRRKQSLERGGARELRLGWHFLTGSRHDIDRLTHAAGYTYSYDAATAQYAHPAGVLVLDRDGRIRTHLFGATFTPAALREAISNAGTDAAPVESEQRWLLCFHYDPRTGRYTPIATDLVRVAALLVMATLGAWLVRTVRRSHSS